MKNFTASKKVIALGTVAWGLLIVGAISLAITKVAAPCADVLIGLGTGLIASAIVSFCFALVDHLNTEGVCISFNINIMSVAAFGNWYGGQVRVLLQRVSVSVTCSGLFFLSSDAAQSPTALTQLAVSKFLELTENTMSQMMREYAKCRLLMKKEYAAVCKHYLGCLLRMKAFGGEEQNAERLWSEFQEATNEVLTYFGFTQEVLNVATEPTSAEQYLKQVTEQKPELKKCLDIHDFISLGVHEGNQNEKK